MHGGGVETPPNRVSSLRDFHIFCMFPGAEAPGWPQVAALRLMNPISALTRYMGFGPAVELVLYRRRPARTTFKIMDVGKSIATFHFGLIGVQIAEWVWILATQDFLDARGILVVVCGSYLALKFWRHDDDLRRWVMASCKMAYVGFPLIFFFGFFSGSPMSINIPFVHAKTDSLAVMSVVLVVVLLYAIALHVLLASRKAIAEFTQQDGQREPSAA